MHPFRFGVVAANATGGPDWLDKARRVESLGYSTLVMPDTVQHTLAPLPALAAAAAVTRTLRLGTYVIDNDFRNPVVLAKEAATLDFISAGRFELGIGAGRPTAADDNRMLGIPFESGAARVARLAEALVLIKALLSGRQASASGSHYQADQAQVAPRAVQQPHPPILVAGGGRQLLRMAAAEADIVALGLPPTATESDAADKIRWLRDAAGDRFDQLELNLNLMAVGQRIVRFVGQQLGLDAQTLGQRAAVSALVGSPEQMCETLLRRREALGISYLLVADELADEFAPVVERMAGR